MKITITNPDRLKIEIEGSPYEVNKFNFDKLLENSEYKNNKEYISVVKATSGSESKKTDRKRVEREKLYEQIREIKKVRQENPKWRKIKIVRYLNKLYPKWNLSYFKVNYWIANTPKDINDV